eukprot:4896866-Prymnesium_polylepis.1
MHSSRNPLVLVILAAVAVSKQRSDTLCAALANLIQRVMRLQPIPHDNIVRVLDRWGPAQTLHCVAALREGRQKDVLQNESDC